MRVPTNLFPNVVSQVIDATVSLKRISHFLKGDELDPQGTHSDISKISAVERQPQIGEYAIRIEDGSFRWDADSTKNTLENINLNVTRCQLSH